MRLSERITRIEAEIAARPIECSPADGRRSVAIMASYEAAIVAYHLGGWRFGCADGFASLLAGMAASHTSGMTRSLLWAAQQAEYRFSGQLGQWRAADRFKAAFDAIGPDRASLVAEIGEVFDRAGELGDPVLIQIAAEREPEELEHV